MVLLGCTALMLLGLEAEGKPVNTWGGERMKKGFEIVSIAAFLLVLGLTAVSEAADGKALFVEKKCNLCHAVDSQGIEKKSAKMKGAELSDAGNVVSDGDWLKKFLTQEELKDGDKHQKKWKGTDEELDAIVNWVMSLKK
jgi:mono/diheme cytochrome c family protein